MSWASDLRSSLTPFQCEREACLTRTLGGLLLCPQWWVCVCRCFLCWVLPLLGGSACGGSHLLSGSMCGCAPCSGGSVCGVLPVLVGLCVGVLPLGVGLYVGVSSPGWVYVWGSHLLGGSVCSLSCWVCVWGCSLSWWACVWGCSLFWVGLWVWVPPLLGESLWGMLLLSGDVWDIIPVPCYTHLSRHSCAFAESLRQLRGLSGHPPSEGSTAGRWMPSWGAPTLPVHGMDIGWPGSGSLVSSMLCSWTKGWKALGALWKSPGPVRLSVRGPLTAHLAFLRPL